MTEPVAQEDSREDDPDRLTPLAKDEPEQIGDYGDYSWRCAL